LRYTDPSGHCVWDLCIAEGAATYWALAGLAALAVAAYESYIFGWGPDAAEHRAVVEDTVDGLFRSQSTSTSSSASQSSAAIQDTGGQTGTPGGLDPNDPWKEFRDYGLKDKDIYELEQRGVNKKRALNDLQFFHNRNIRITGHALNRMQIRNIDTTRVAALYNRMVDVQAFETVDGYYMIVNGSGTQAIITDAQGLIVSVWDEEVIASALETAVHILTQDIPWVVP
jgi:hypothetical protein